MPNNNLRNRAENAERRVPPEPTREEERDRLLERFHNRLTREELAWWREPGEQAQDLVPCPHVESIKCGCRSTARKERGFAANPQLRDEAKRRWLKLAQKGEEILARPAPLLHGRPRQER